jgi:hypothetical protein
MVTQPVRSQHQETCARQDQRSASDKRCDRPEEQNFYERILSDLPFRKGAGEREHDGRAEHKQNAERDTIGAQARALVKAVGGQGRPQRIPEPA